MEYVIYSRDNPFSSWRKLKTRIKARNTIDAQKQLMKRSKGWLLSGEGQYVYQNATFRYDFPTPFTMDVKYESGSLIRSYKIEFGL